LVISKFAVSTENVQPKIDRKHRLYFRWEDEVFEKEALLSFEYQTSFKETAEDGVKSWIQGMGANGDVSEI
jgi:hypothetical protein